MRSSFEKRVEQETVQQNHSKRWLLASDTEPTSSTDNDSTGSPISGDPVLEQAEEDPIVQLFYQLKQQYALNGASEINRRKRHDLQSEIVKVLGDIRKQELRQRVKKRAPVEPTTDTKGIEEKHTVGQHSKRPDTEADGEVEGEESELTGDDGQEAGGEYQPVGEEQPDDGIADIFRILDPGFRYQWHLHNTRDGHDINVTGVWEQGINGSGVNVAIIDDGLDMTSEDLAPNFFKEGSWDFNDHTALPKPRLVDDLHGTRCAGEIAAAKNNLCGLGVAYGAKVAGLRILSGQITDVDEAAALNYRFQDNHIYSCSWGPPDDGKSMNGPKGVVLDAMVNGIKNGRSGLGSIYVFATGNGGSQDDDCNFDGYTNSLYTISIGAIDRARRHPYYSETCSAQLAVTYSNGGGSAIYTCDVGQRRCFGEHGGTSAAAPIAAGMIALVLSVRPDLGWRDIQYLLMNTAIPVSLNDTDWKTTAAGRLFNHKFGYGSLDAYALVEAAKRFQSLGPQTFLEPPVVTVGRKIPQSDKGLTSSLMITEQDLAEDGVQLGTLEHITVTVNIQHERRGDVEVFLRSPNNVESKLGARRRFDTSVNGFVNWTFMTVKHWEEDPVGEWTLVVQDRNNPKYSGTFVDWKIKFWGEVRKQVANISTEPSMPKQPEEEQILNALPAKVNENDGDQGNDEGTTKDEGDEGMTPWQSDGKGAKAQSVDEAKTEANAARTASRTLYMFCGVLGLAMCVGGYLTRHRWNERGQYSGTQGDSGSGIGSDSGRRGRDIGNEEDDIDMLPRRP
ncbi:pheromone processing endoprotease [Mortierella polycephala]|uniref:Pheromone processing endoprotease n=1 Tax=Mortierella polycephala TaxID=41804 RepID=A0A9P6Q4N1_9FUNG|nr:pheromone processing endoprotease [Mortierella polycephala]